MTIPPGQEVEARVAPLRARQADGGLELLGSDSEGPRYRHDRVAYTEVKGPFIDETTLLAEAWAAATGWQP